MYFKMKNTLKNNHNSIIKQRLKILSFCIQAFIEFITETIIFTNIMTFHTKYNTPHVASYYKSV
jgi:hypothetical protein